MQRPRNHRKLMSLLRSKGIGDEGRRRLVYRFSCGGASSSKDLSEAQIEVLCECLENSFENQDKEALITMIQKKKKISLILSIATRLGLHDVNDWGHFNNFMLKRSKYKKPLREHTLTELCALLGQFKKIEISFKKQAEKKGFDAFYIKNRFPDPSLN